MEHLWLTRSPGHLVCRPEDLGYRTDVAALDAPAVRREELGEGTEVELRVGPGHHQVVVTHEDRRWIETVGVFEDTADQLPIQRSETHPTPFVSPVETGCTVTEHSPRGLRKELRRLWETLGNAPLALAVQDPGEPAAVTAATCHTDTVTRTLMWWTWRVLPEAGFVVRTRAELRLGPAVGVAA